MKLILILAMAFLFSCSESKKVETSYYSNNRVKYKVDLRNGKRHGVLTSYYETGKLKATSEWKDGVVNGKIRRYYPTGELLSLEIWKDGRENGLSKEFYKNGKLKYEAFCIDDKTVGKVIFYYDNGKIKEQRNYNDDGDFLLSIVKYDQHGKEVYKALTAITATGKDTINKGQIYTLKIMANSQMYDSMQVLLGSLNDKNQLLDTVKIWYGRSTLFNYSIKADKIGSNHVSGLVTAFNTKGKFDAHSTAIRHPYYVKSLPVNRDL